jgi:hypothetical protein
MEINKYKLICILSILFFAGIVVGYITQHDEVVYQLREENKMLQEHNALNAPIKYIDSFGCENNGTRKDK